MFNFPCALQSLDHNRFFTKWLWTGSPFADVYCRSLHSQQADGGTGTEPGEQVAAYQQPGLDYSLQRRDATPVYPHMIASAQHIQSECSTFTLSDSPGSVALLSYCRCGNGNSFHRFHSTDRTYFTLSEVRDGEICTGLG